MAGTTTSASSARSTTGVRCIIVTPEATVLDTRGRFVSLPLFDGQRGVGRGHAPFIGRLGVGEVRITGEQGSGAEQVRCSFVEGGFVEVGQDTVTIITQRAIAATTLDAKAARANLETLRTKKATGDDAIAARLQAEEAARAMVRVAERAS